MQEIEQRAEDVLAGVPSWIWDGESLPVPVERIADSHFGLLVREMDDLGRAPGAPELAEDQGLSGLLLTDRGEIWVNAAEAAGSAGRRRFTICHELGHWCMHRAQGEDERAVFCRSATVGPDVVEGPDIELQAQVFAAALLMPARLVRAHYRAENFDFFAFCNRFGASGAAMGRRLHRVI